VTVSLADRAGVHQCYPWESVVKVLRFDLPILAILDSQIGF
jgi:hypothetical protein